MSSNQLRIMIYGAESLGYKVPATSQNAGNYILEFCPVKTDKDFSEFDVVIFFERLFETVQQDEIICNDRSEMLKRAKQVFKLIEKGGYVCLLFYDIRDKYVISGYLDSHSYPSRDTNLAKVLLNDYGIDDYIRKSIDTPLKHFKIYRSEYKKYLEDYGVCQTSFQIPSYKKINIKAICGIWDIFTGMIIEEQIFVLPCHAPDKDESATIRLFSMLASSLYESISKLSKEIPPWIDEGLVFPEEKKLTDNLHHLTKEIAQIEANLKLYKIFKGCLAHSGDALVESVSTIFESFFKLRVIKDEQFVDDIKLYIPQENEDKMIALVEIKGVNSGIKREHINQADSHRERSGLPSSFPVLLIMNTKMDATKFEEKELEVAHEQVKKAVADNILIMRTFDLMNFVYLIEESVTTLDDFLSLLQTANGWIKVTKEAYEIRKE
jgi:hypothetical protein